MWRGYGSKNGYIGQSGDVWDATAERVVASPPPPPSPPPYQFPKEEERGKWEESSAAIKFVVGHNGDGVVGGSVEGRES